MKNFSIQIMSDIHLEFPNSREMLPEVPVLSPILALLGDIGNPMKETYRNFLYEMSEKYEHVLVIAGNHEFYCNTISGTQFLIEEICKQRKNIHFLNRKSVDLDTLEELNIRIIGTTMWTNIPDEHLLRVGMSLSDYKKIFVYPEEQHESEKSTLRSLFLKNLCNQSTPSSDDHSLQSNIGNDQSVDTTIEPIIDLNVVQNRDDVEEVKSEGEKVTDYFMDLESQKLQKWNSELQNKTHLSEVQFIESEIERAMNDNKKLVILTHHAPTDQNTNADKYKDNQHVKFIDGSVLHHLMNYDHLLCWAYGHTHYSSDQIIGKCRVISNQVGYVRRHDPGFDPTLTIPLWLSRTECEAIVNYRSQVLNIVRNHSRMVIESNKLHPRVPIPIDESYLSKNKSDNNNANGSVPDDQINANNYQNFMNTSKESCSIS